MNRYDIHATLKKKGHSLASLALELQVSKTAMTNVVADQRTSRRIATRIAQIVGQPPHVLWPKRYERTSTTPQQKAA